MDFTNFTNQDVLLIINLFKRIEKKGILERLIELRI